MLEKTTVVTDDFTGERLAPEAVHEVTFSLNGRSFELDLNAANAARLAMALAPFIRVARETTPGRKVTTLPPVRPPVARRPTKKAPPPSAPVVQAPPEPPPTKPTTVLRPKHSIEPGVFVHQAPATPEVDMGPTLSPPTEASMRDIDWSKLTVEQLESDALKLRGRFADGLPEAIRFTYYPEVLALDGFDAPRVESVLRHPDRVEVAPETYNKHYPILRFHRGDACTVLGLRNLAKPAIIAAYHGSLTGNDWYRVNHGSGGGARALTGLPKTPKQLAQRLEGLGARVEFEKGTESAAPVVFKGDELGKVSVGTTVPRATVENDWQRMARKIEAINRRREDER